jgi:hypothetical protein
MTLKGGSPHSAGSPCHQKAATAASQSAVMAISCPGLMGNVTRSTTLCVQVSRIISCKAVRIQTTYASEYVFFFEKPV